MAAEPRVPIAIWLVPAASDHARLAERIAALGAAHGGPAFEPHVTVHVGTVVPGCDAAAALARVAARWSPVRLEAAATGQSEAYYQTLFVPFAADRADAPRLAGLQRDVVTELAPAASATELAAYRLNPHLSLLYARLPAPVRTALCTETRYAGEVFAFDTLAAVRPRDGCTDLAEVDRWHVFGHCRLGGR